MNPETSDMSNGTTSEHAAAFPLRTRLRVAVAASVLLALVGGLAFVGLSRLSGMKVFKSIVIFGESEPWPEANVPLALAVRTLDNGRFSAPKTSQLIVSGSRLTPAFTSHESIAFSLPVGVPSGPLRGSAQASALSLDAPLLPFEVGPAVAAPPAIATMPLKGLGGLIRAASLPTDEVAPPFIGPAAPGCTDLVTVVPSGGVAQQLMQTLLLVRLTDAAGVARTAVEVELLGTRLGAPPSPRAAASTSSFGLAELSVVLDRDTDYLLRWRCGGAEVTAPMQLSLLADGMVAAWEPAPVPPHAAVRIETSELRSRATWQGDLFCSGRWTATVMTEFAAGAHQIEISLPPSAAGHLCLFQASNKPYLLHPQQASTWLLPAQDSTRLREGALELFDAMRRAAGGQLASQLGPQTRDLLAAADDATLSAGLRWMLAWLPRRFEQRPILADSRDRDLAAVAAEKSLWRSRFRFALAASVAGLMLIWLPGSIAGLRADDRTARTVSLEVSEGSEALPRLTRSRRTIALLLLAALLALAALAALVWIVS
jgi:hypothetical protein